MPACLLHNMPEKNARTYPDYQGLPLLATVQEPIWQVTAVPVSAYRRHPWDPGAQQHCTVSLLGSHLAMATLAISNRDLRQAFGIRS
jgi:hypothetical protein